MYIPSHHFEEEQEQEVICVFTGERYVYLEGDDLTLIDPKYHEGALESLPNKFFKVPFMVMHGEGNLRVFGSVD